MTRRFKSIKKFNILFILLIPIVYIVFIFILKSLTKTKIYKSNQDLVKKLIIGPNHLLSQSNDNYLTQLISLTTNIDMKKPISLINQTINFSNYYLDDIDNFLKNPKDNNDPIVYLYSSNFDRELVNKNNIDLNSTILLLYILKGILDKHNISTIALNINLNDIIELNNKNPYEISRLYLEEQINKYSLKLCLDVQIGNNEAILLNNKKYAKITFVVNENYENNISKLKNIISNNYKELLTENEITENSLNYDLNNIVVLKIGSENSDLEEIYNTFNILSDCIKKWLGDIYG